MLWCKQHGNDAIIFIHAQPRASKSAVMGPHGTPPRLKIRLAAPPVDGEANEELLNFLAKKLKLPKSRLELVRGATSKQKNVLCTNSNADEIIKTLLAGT